MRRSVVGAALMLLLAGCGGNPKADPPPSTSPTPSVSATPSPPALPEAAKANTRAGAIAFVRHYIELVNYAQMTGDVSALSIVEDPGCKSCSKGRDYLSRIYGAGGHIAGGAWTVRHVRAKKSGENWAVTATGDFASSDAYASPGADPQHADGGPALTNFIVWHSDQWKVRAWFSG
jgi:hypothetical protein